VIKSFGNGYYLLGPNYRDVGRKLREGEPSCKRLIDNSVVCAWAHWDPDVPRKLIRIVKIKDFGE
jgi:hypothetical protein